MAGYNFTANFNAVPTGPMTRAAKLAVWGNPADNRTYSQAPNPPVLSLYDADPNGTFFSIDPRGANGGNCCRMRYPGGSVGMGSQFYQLQLGKPNAIVNLEFDLLLESGFDDQQDPGKLSPCIQWGSIASGSTGGVRQMMVWESGQNKPKRFCPVLQDQRTGLQLVQPSYYGATIQFDRWYHWQYQILGGPNGWTKFWMDGQLLSTTIANMGNSTPGDTVFIDFAFFAGGIHGALVDSYARHDNVHIWTTTPVDSVTLQGGPMSLIAGGVAQKYQAVFKNSATGTIIVPSAQVQFASADTTKVTIAPVAGTFDQFVASPIKANDDGSPAVVGISCMLPASSLYSGYSGVAALPPVTTLTIDLVVFQPVS